MHFDGNLPFILATDASSYGIGVVLSHKFPKGTERPIPFVSRTLNESESRYSLINKEAVVMYWGVDIFLFFVWVAIYSTNRSNAAVLCLSATRLLNYNLFP